MSDTIPCLRCGDPYTMGKHGRRSHYCPPCRPLVRNERKLERYHYMEGLKAEIRETASEWVASGGLESRKDETPLFPQVDDWIDTWDFAETFVTRDRMPEGWYSAAGPDEGATTEYEDLAEQLEARRREVMGHPWFKEHPHWYVALS